MKLELKNIAVGDKARRVTGIGQDGMPEKDLCSIDLSERIHADQQELGTSSRRRGVPHGSAAHNKCCKGR